MINTEAEVKLIGSYFFLSLIHLLIFFFTPLFADFGNSSTYKLTQKKLVGTLQYISPEMIGQGRVDGGIDIWAVGMSLIGFFSFSFLSLSFFPLSLCFSS